MSIELDFRLDDFEAADADSEYQVQQFWAGDLTVMAEHHTAPNGSHSFVVAHDGSVTWGVPGKPQIAAIKVARDLNASTFTFEKTYHPSVSLAQNWLIERGCTPAQIAQVGDDFMKPADDLTTRIEQQLRTSADRYKVLASYTSDYDPCETWTLTRDTQAAEEPVRLFLEEGDYDTHTYTVREGAFPDEASARKWLDDREDLLPLPPEAPGETAALRTRAALSRSTGASTAAKASPGPPGTATAPFAQRPNPGRSM